MSALKIKKGDTVKVITGKDKKASNTTKKYLMVIMV